MENQKRHRWTSATIHPIIQGWERSGMSQVAFARQEGLSQAVLSYWLCKYREEQGSTEPGFAAVTPGRAVPVSIFRGRQDENGSSVVFARLLLPDGAELHFHQSVPGVYLREVLGW